MGLFGLACGYDVMVDKPGNGVQAVVLTIYSLEEVVIDPTLTPINPWDRVIYPSLSIRCLC